ncbi:MAG: sugar transferase [Candidatus Yanofskybacteria bacterium]|nr:sugar transferase [Candidatus Yanofskybacteria bacterium]
MIYSDKSFPVSYGMRKFLLFLGDIITLYLALFLTLYARYGRSFDEQISMHFLPFTIIFVVWVIVFYISNLYEIGLSKNNARFFSDLFYTIAVISSISIFFFYFVQFFRIAPKTNLFVFIVIIAALQGFWRFFFNRLTAKNGYKNNTLIVGLSQQSQELYDFLLNNPQLGYGVLGILDIGDKTASAILDNLIKRKNIRTLVLAPTVYKIPHIIDVFYHLVGFGINFFNLSDFYERVAGRIPLETIDQVWFLENLSQGSRRGYETGKRILDLIGTIIIGLLTLPFYPLIILAIKLDSRGQVFYHQGRMGRIGKIFTVIKFRTMFQEIEKSTGPIWAAENDARTTRVGKFLRKTRIDELPQIWNILRGEMSFVGPRPERPEFHQKLKSEIPFYEERYLVKPGLTGWAQIKYKLDFRGGMTIKDTYEKLQHDLFYIKNRSLILDLGILLKTINILLKKAFR